MRLTRADRKDLKLSARPKSVKSGDIKLENIVYLVTSLLQWTKVIIMVAIRIE